MLSIEECRKMLPDSEKLTDGDVMEIREQSYQWADIVFECYMEERKKLKKQQEGNQPTNASPPQTSKGL